MSEEIKIQNYRTSSAFEAFRGISKAAKDFLAVPETTPIMDTASIFGEENKSGLTIALEDYSEKVKSLHGSDRSNISAKDAQKGGFQSFMENIGLMTPSYGNIYETPTMQAELQNRNIFQNDIFAQAKVADNGIRYANEGDDIYESALNFARADIEAIEKAYEIAYNVRGNGKLDYGEITTYAKGFNQLSMADLDLDGNVDNITAEEYAAFLIAADGAFVSDTWLGLGYDPDSIDGLITEDEAMVSKNFDDTKFKQYAQKIYDEYYNNKKKK